MKRHCWPIPRLSERHGFCPLCRDVIDEIQELLELARRLLVE
jgi:hypothetical protein